MRRRRQCSQLPIAAAARPCQFIKKVTTRRTQPAFLPFLRLLPVVGLLRTSLLASQRPPLPHTHHHIPSLAAIVAVGLTTCVKVCFITKRPILDYLIYMYMYTYKSAHLFAAQSATAPVLHGIRHPFFRSPSYTQASHP
ncbi:hypothetical protein IF2G_10046 [Cordyceps javanica]|nr:hypothetical protein IF2G_10046 [Cordyceps javanica]